jgi:hypothetical protein
VLEDLFANHDVKFVMVAQGGTHVEIGVIEACVLPSTACWRESRR